MFVVKAYQTIHNHGFLARATLSWRLTKKPGEGHTPSCEVLICLPSTLRLLTGKNWAGLCTCPWWSDRPSNFFQMLKAMLDDFIVVWEFSLCRIVFGFYRFSVTKTTIKHHGPSIATTLINDETTGTWMTMMATNHRTSTGVNNQQSKNNEILTAAVCPKVDRSFLSFWSNYRRGRRSDQLHEEWEHETKHFSEAGWVIYIYT